MWSFTTSDYLRCRVTCWCCWHFGQSPQSAQPFIRRSHSTSNFQLWACIIEMWFPLAGGLSTCPTTTNCFSDHIESAENCEEKDEKPSNLYQTNLWSNNIGLLLRRRKSDTFLLHLTQHLHFCFYSEQNRLVVWDSWMVVVTLLQNWKKLLQHSVWYVVPGSIAKSQRSK